MRIEDLYPIISDFSQIGYMEAVKAYEPPQDVVRKSDVQRWLKMMRIDFKAFKALVSMGLIEEKKMGKSENSPIVYSKTQIKKAMATMKIEKIYDRHIHR